MCVCVCACACVHVCVCACVCAECACVCAECACVRVCVCVHAVLMRYSCVPAPTFVSLLLYNWGGRGEGGGSSCVA